ncbi:tRNA (adenosine(37)-N6)-threonylcarbamoyltransferase complex dimerization subunit type 1 TsaB [Woodsholea maritima]|uniref:tRNA (adenosine(37)-N6)-threonylcarbamoyltransferase complex dimerization subunit type 1 TsaB n=1 Tax=Woodsholea maritima TaxID=240237 RepID=UPI00036042B6|nr:tRNA (adenosine(37)-N6)-threonylcarbamoyltransferase complex dimerization subunit type 1 TsaB [Woodsholea maritima]
MRILVLDTTGQECGAALKEGETFLQRRHALGRGQAEHLAPLIEALLSEAGWSPDSLGRIGVTIGPGSFAGTRVGVAFARGLALATGAKAIGISNLELWALGADPKRDKSILTVHDAKRGDVIVQAFQNGTALNAPERISLDAAKALDLSGYDDVVGSGAGLLEHAEPSIALDFLTFAALVAAKHPCDAPPVPFYARPPDAKLPGGQDPV